MSLAAELTKLALHHQFYAYNPKCVTIIIGYVALDGTSSLRSINDDSCGFTAVRLAQQSICDKLQEQIRNGPTKCPFRKARPKIDLVETAPFEYWGS